MTESRRLLQHFLAALAYRTQKALRGAPAGFGEFRAGVNLRTPFELVWHMTGVIGYARTMLHGGTFTPPRLPTFAEEIERFHATLHALRDDFGSLDLTATISDEQFLQGPLSDAMTHAGQLAMLRRMAGSPVASENFIFAHVHADNVSAAQAEPAAPDSWWRADLPPTAPGERPGVDAGRPLTKYAGQIAAVVLAAGGSSRMGRPKQLIIYDGVPLVARAAGAALGAGAQPVIVVLGANAPEVEAALMHLAGITVVVNPDWATGLASSLTAGLRASLTTQCEGVLVTLADQPHVDSGVLAQLIGRFQGGARIVAAGYQGSPGVPALFGREHVPSLLDLTGDAGAGAWLRERGHQVDVIPFDEVLLDLDTPLDMK